MDLKEIKSRLNSLQTKSSPTGGKRNIFWRPEVGKQVVRVVPNKFNKSNPFTEAFFYYGIGQRVMISPTNFGESDPIAEFAKQLRQTSDRDNWRLAKKLDAKNDYIREHAESAYHPCGTCKMGSPDDKTAVVDSECRVIGADNLRVADSSIFPRIPYGNLNAPSMMTGEKAAAHVLGELLPPDGRIAAAD